MDSIDEAVLLPPVCVSAVAYAKKYLKLKLA